MKMIHYIPAFVVTLLFAGGLRADASSFANTTSISIRDTTTAVPYPSAITVSGLTGTVSSVTIQLNGLSHGSPSDIEMLLVGPAGEKFVFFSDAGGVHSVVNFNVALADAGASLVPASSLTTGTFKPTDYGGVSGSFAAPAPTVSGSDLAPPAGSVSFTTQFFGTDPNGVWNLYVMDDVSGSSGTLAGGWTLSITTVPPATTLTTLQSSPNPSFSSVPTSTVIFTAIVASSGIPVAQGTLTFRDGASILMTNVALSAGGQARYTNDTFVEGSHFITASYSGTAGFGVSSNSV